MADRIATGVIEITAEVAGAITQLKVINRELERVQRTGNQTAISIAKMDAAIAKAQIAAQLLGSAIRNVSAGMLDLARSSERGAKALEDIEKRWKFLKGQFAEGLGINAALEGLSGFLPEIPKAQRVGNVGFPFQRQGRVGDYLVGRRQDLENRIREQQNIVDAHNAASTSGSLGVAAGFGFIPPSPPPETEDQKKLSHMLRQREAMRGLHQAAVSFPFAANEVRLGLQRRIGRLGGIVGDTLGSVFGAFAAPLGDLPRQHALAMRSRAEAWMANITIGPAARVEKARRELEEFEERGRPRAQQVFGDAASFMRALHSATGDQQNWDKQHAQKKKELQILERTLEEMRGLKFNWLE